MTQDIDKDQHALLAKITTALDKQVTDIDPLIAQRLATARHTALQELRKPVRRIQPLTMLAMAASVIAVVIATLLWQANMPGTIPALDDMPILSAGEDFELLEDLDFYRWLEVEKRAV